MWLVQAAVPTRPRLKSVIVLPQPVQPTCAPGTAAAAATAAANAQVSGIQQTHRLLTPFFHYSQTNEQLLQAPFQGRLYTRQKDSMAAAVIQGALYDDRMLSPQRLYALVTDQLQTKEELDLLSHFGQQASMALQKAQRRYDGFVDQLRLQSPDPVHFDKALAKLWNLALMRRWVSTIAFLRCCAHTSSSSCSRQPLSSYFFSCWSSLCVSSKEHSRCKSDRGVSNLSCLVLLTVMSVYRLSRALVLQHWLWRVRVFSFVLLLNVSVDSLCRAL